MLDRLPGVSGIGLDVSPYALRRAARCHPRAAAIGADVWSRLPLATGAFGVITCVFGPRNGAEFARVLAPGGALIVVTPGPDHLRELREEIGLIGLDPAKDERLTAQLEQFAQVSNREVRFAMELGPAAIGDLVGMGPSARHLAPGVLRERVKTREPAPVSAHVRVATYQLNGDVRGRG